MDPYETGRRYDRIVTRWDREDGVSAHRERLRDSGCTCILSDHDQPHERHVLFMARKDPAPAAVPNS